MTGDPPGAAQVVVSVEGYLATVFFLEKSLSFQVAQKGVSEVANSLGLLDQTKAWALEKALIFKMQLHPPLTSRRNHMNRAKTLYFAPILRVREGIGSV